MCGGVLTYVMYVGSLWYFDEVGKFGFPIATGVIIGVGAGCVFITAGYIQVAYPEENEKGLYITTQLNLQAVGSVTGGISKSLPCPLTISGGANHDVNCFQSPSSSTGTTIRVQAFRGRSTSLSSSLCVVQHCRPCCYFQRISSAEMTVVSWQSIRPVGRGRSSELIYQSSPIGSC